jgi:hypothetical protein
LSPSHAIEQLAAFGESITRTFHENLKNAYGTQALRPLGTLAFIETARALGGEPDATAPEALLALTVLNENATFALERFLEGEMPPPDQVAIEERLVSAPA